MAFYALTPQFHAFAQANQMTKAEIESLLTDEWLFCNRGKLRFYGGENKGPDPDQYIVGLNPITKKKLKIHIPFHGHHVDYNANNKLLATGDKWGSRIAIANSQKEKLEKVIFMPTNHSFFGHVQWSNDGTKLYAVAQDQKII